MKYKGLIYHGAKDFRMEELEMPEVGDKDVILKCVVASVCGADADTWLNGGEMHYFPEVCEFGHEVSCEVYAVGKDVEGISVGDRVAPFPLMTTPNPRKAGYLGGFSEYIYCTNASYATNLLKLPENVSYEEAALVEPLSVGLRGADIVPMDESKKALILGAGFIGFALAAGLVWKGVKPENIAIVDKSPYRLAICKDAGYHAINSTQSNWKEQVIAAIGAARSVYGPGCDADVIYDCAGSRDPDSSAPTLMEEGIQLLKYFGKFVCVGVHRRQPKLNTQKLVFGMYDILCGSGNTHEYFELAVEILASKKFDFTKTIAEAYSKEHMMDAILASCDTDHVCMRVQIDYRK